MSRIRVGDLVSWGQRKQDRDVIVRIEGDEAYFGDESWCELSELTLVEDDLSAMKSVSMRDYFAAKAMAALMPIYWETQEEYESAKEMVKCQVESAYEYADAMILQRGK